MMQQPQPHPHLVMSHIHTLLQSAQSENMKLKQLLKCKMVDNHQLHQKIQQLDSTYPLIILNLQKEKNEAIAKHLECEEKYQALLDVISRPPAIPPPPHQLPPPAPVVVGFSDKTEKKENDLADFSSFAYFTGTAGDDSSSSVVSDLTTPPVENSILVDLKTEIKVLTKVIKTTVTNSYDPKNRWVLRKQVLSPQEKKNIFKMMDHANRIFESFYMDQSNYPYRSACDALLRTLLRHYDTLEKIMKEYHH